MQQTVFSEHSPSNTILHCKRKPIKKKKKVTICYLLTLTIFCFSPTLTMTYLILLILHYHSLPCMSWSCSQSLTYLVPPYLLLCTNTVKLKAHQPFKSSSGLFAVYLVHLTRVPLIAKPVTRDTHQYELCEIKYCQLQGLISGLTTYTAQPVWAPLALSLRVVIQSKHTTAAGGSKKPHFINSSQSDMENSPENSWCCLSIEESYFIAV